MWSSALPWATLLIVAAALAGIAVGRWPLLRANRPVIALLGTALLLAVGALTPPQLYESVDYGTILLLFSMMMLNGTLFLAGFFGVVTRQILRVASGPRTLLALIIVASGLLSALFLNDTVVLMLTPIVLDTTRALKRNPLPYLLGLATAANVGSAATITGNPQNIVIGSASGIPYLRFAAAIGPTSLIGLAICWLVVVAVHRREFRGGSFQVPDVSRSAVLRPLLIKGGLAVGGMLVMFLAGVPVAMAAFLAAAAMAATRRLRPKRVFATVDWPLLVFFCGLFALTHGLDVQGWTQQLFALLAPLAQAGLVPFGIATVVLSNLISNVPAVLLLQGLVPSLADPQRGWLMLAAASTLAGNLTLLGSVANLIVAELAERWGARVSFMDYLRVGLPVTLLTLAVAFALI
ncbi:anion transporter [Chloroflexia bacterium SDU3-3]|nr:anion transporter [Chloroflexia bacterium SDU3-3]